MNTPANPSPKLLEGRSRLQAGDTAGARALLEEVLADNPGDYNARHFLGVSYLQEGDPISAIQHIAEALALKPDSAAMLSNLGAAHFAREDFETAATSFQKALGLQPDNASLHYNLGNAYFATSRRSAAAGHYRQAYMLQPDHTEALALYVYCSALACSWSDKAARDTLLAAARDNTYAGPPFILHALLDDPAAHLNAARHYAARKAGSDVPPPTPARNQRIRLAYVSSDFGQSAVSHLITGLLEDHDRGQFEVYAIALSPGDGSALRARVERAVDKFVDGHGLSDAQVARIIRDLGVDVAIDLNGHTAGSRLRIFSYRPARIQVSYLGFSGTTGCTFFDYIIVDPFVVPADQQLFYTETLAPLRGCFLPSDARRATIDHAPSRQACGLPEQGFVFCCFNNSYEITPDIFEIWMRLLNAVPGSVLWLTGDAEVQTNLQREAASRDVAPTRLVFAPKLADITEHLARYRLADLFLDTFPYNAATTAGDALWMGLPLLTMSGRTYAARMAGSILRAIGLNDMVTASPAAYEQRALALATDPQALAHVKALLVQNREVFPLFDADRYRRDMEDIYRAMMKAADQT